MNLRNFLIGLFRGHNANGELDGIRDAAKQDARLVVGTYVQEFEAEASRLLTDRQQRFVGLIEADTTDDEGIIDVDPIPVAVDRSGWSRPELMAECRKRDIGYDRYAKKGHLIDLLG